MNYQIADFIIRLKNASLAKRRKIVVPYHNINKAVGKVLVKEGFLESLKEVNVSGKKVLEIVIKYDRRNPVLTDVLIVSKPSLRVYTNSKNILEVQKKGTYTAILSTNKGIMTGKDARKNAIGGEVLFKVR